MGETMLRIPALAIGLLAVAASGADAKPVTVLHAFAGADGAFPQNDLAVDAQGNLYGTTVGGMGNVFKLAGDGTLNVLHTFTGGTDGERPFGGVALDKAGNLYGITSIGGDPGCSQGPAGCGTVFKIAPDGTESILYAFAGGSDGYSPSGGLAIDRQGNLYGVTEFGGLDACGNGGVGCGTVFKLAPDGTKTTLYKFAGGPGDGFLPLGAPLLDAPGNIYGTTGLGGARDGGIVFKLGPDGSETVLYAFGNRDDARLPEAGLVADDDGNLYGTSADGGTARKGTVFKLAPDGTETVLHSFAGGDDGKFPHARLLIDRAGKLFGTTFDGAGRYGTVFSISPGGKERVIHGFRRGAGMAGGTNPLSGLTAGKSFHLFGTTEWGGSAGMGVVYEIMP